jgi:hypothetical protein
LPQKDLPMTNDEQPRDASVLDHIFQRPAMYWGNSANHFHSFVAFVSGYQIARGELLGEEEKRQLDEVIPPRFHEFVTEYYGHRFPYGGYGWTSFIEKNTNSDREALDLFMKLRRLYDEQHKGEQGDGKPPPALSESR